MSDKYRIKIDDRIVGPFSSKQVGELYSQGKIQGTESAQKYPLGNWTTILEINELKNIITRLIENKISSDDLKDDHGTLVKLDVAKKLRESKEQQRIDEISNRKKKVEELEIKAKKEEFKEFTFDKVEKEETKVTTALSEENEDKKANIEKTVIVNRDDLKSFEKTVITRPPPIEEPKELEEEAEKEAEEEIVVEEAISADEKTQFFSLDKNVSELYKEASAEESAAENIEQASPVETGSKKKKKNKKENNKEQEKPKKKMKPIVAFAFIVVIYMLLFPEDGKKKPIDPKKVIFQSPVTKEVRDLNKSQLKLQEGIKYYNSGTYSNRVLAASFFKQSLEYSFKDNPALGHLILTYGELYPNAFDKEKAAQTLFRLIEISRARQYKDINILIGSALFYKYADKKYTSIQLIENYLRVGKPSIKLLGLYLDLLIEVGDLLKAREVLEKFEPIKNKNHESYLSISKFYKVEERFEKGQEIVEQALGLYSSSVALLLEYVSYLFRQENLPKIAEILKRVEALRAEDNPIYYAKFLEYAGMMSAISKDNKTAAFLFKQALAIYDSDELRSKLASLDIGGSTAVENLIVESKLKDLIQKTKKYRDEKKWDKAFKVAIEASDLSPKYIPAQLNLAKLQIKRGFYESAITTLLELKKEYPLNSKIYLLLIEAYIESRKLNEASLEINNMASNPQLQESFEFATLWARFYYKSNKYALALKWYNTAIQRNPLSDDSYYMMGNIYLKNRLYKKAKTYLGKAISLDPLNLEYRTSYSEILFELDGPELGISYLRDQLKESIDNPKLLAQIAIFYYKNGQIQDFEIERKKLENLNSKDSSLYEFLIKMGTIENNVQQVINSSKELILINPSDLQTRMLLAEYEFKANKFGDAIASIESVLARLESYPRAHYLLSKIYIKLNKLDLALKHANEEIKHNPNIYYGWYVAGQIYKIKREVNPAVKNLEKAISIDVNNVESLLALGEIKLQQNHYELSREYFDRAKRLEPDRPETRKLLGEVYRRIGQSALAIEEYDTYLKLDPAARDRAEIQKIINYLKR